MAGSLLGVWTGVPPRNPLLVSGRRVGFRPIVIPLHQTKLGSFLAPKAHISINNAGITYFNRRSDAMLTIEEAIINKLRSGPCGSDELVIDLSDFSWAQLFDAVDCMSRDGRLSLRHLGLSIYRLSLGPQFAHPNTPVREAAAPPM